MTLYQIIRRLETFSLTLPNVRTASDGDVYAGLNDNPELKYGVFFVTQNTHQELEDMDRYGLTLFYIDRLDDTLEDNRLQIQSIGKEVLSVILRDFCEEYNIDFPTVNYTPFTQKFKDETAGVYAQITLDVIKGICADDFSDIISIYQTKTVNLTENGQFIVTPDESYTALEKVIINVDVACESYEQGFEDGKEAQKALLSSITINQNGDYSYENGYSAITVNVPQSGGGDYQQGFEDGVEYQKSLLSSATFNQNGNYTNENGYSAVTVSVPQTGHTDEELEEAFQSGITYQKSLLSSATFNQNGVYTSPENGWSAITIDVSGYTQEDLDNAYNQGYIDGIEDCEKPYLAVSETEISLSSSAQSKTVEVFSNINWNVINYPQWCTVSPISGTNDGSITITVSANTEYNRQGTITLQSSDLTKTVQITLKQAGSYVPSDYETEYFTIEAQSAGTLYWKADSSAFTRTIEYSKNGGTWTSVTSSDNGSGAVICGVKAGDIVRFRGNNETYCSEAYNEGANHNMFKSNCNHIVYGNMMSLVYGDNFIGKKNFITGHTFCSIFKKSKTLTDATNLVLPATTLTTMCYYRMFAGCSSLTSAPSILPATTLANYCYDSMFTRCKSLIKAPELPATTLTKNCYNSMFWGCSSLVQAPELPATTLAQSCYRSMFDGCTNLNYIKCLATNISANNCTTGWVDGVAATGTFYRKYGMAGWTRGVNGVPVDWTVISV